MDLSELKGIINLMQKSDLSELEIELQDLKLRLARPGAAQPFTNRLSISLRLHAPTPPCTSEKADSSPPQRSRGGNFQISYGRYFLP